MNKRRRLLKVEEPCELFSGQICSKRHLLHRERSPIEQRCCLFMLLHYRGGRSFHFSCLEKIKLLMFWKVKWKYGSIIVYLLWDTSLSLIQALHYFLHKFNLIPIEKTNIIDLKQLFFTWILMLLSMNHGTHVECVVGHMYWKRHRPILVMYEYWVAL